MVNNSTMSKGYTFSCVDYKRPHTKKEFLKLLKTDEPNLIIHIFDIKCDVTVNDEIYSRKDEKFIKNLVKRMSNNIWLDRTYVCFDGNRFKDAFIKEEGWYELNKRLIEDTFIKKRNKEDEKDTVMAMMSVILHYMYDMIIKYGYDIEEIEITTDDKISFNTEYFIDNRTSWNF